jgi:ligand-binding SRPBCC domain-containing protein
MPHHYIASVEIAHPLADLFAYFIRPKNLVQLAPAELNLELLTSPEILTLGSVLQWKGRRFGVSQQFTHEVSAFESEKLIVLEQKKGPFARWIHRHQFEATATGTKIMERIDFDPPRGLLGYVITADGIRRDLDKLMAHREKKLKEIFG